MDSTRWMLDQFDGELEDYCVSEARKLTAMGLLDEETGKPIPYHEWLEEIVRHMYHEHEWRRGQFCAQMYDQ